MITTITESGLQSAFFVRIQIDEYRTTPIAGYTSQTLRFSDWQTPVDVSGETYQSLGNLMSIGNSTSQLRVSEQTVSVAISGIPNSAIAEIVNSKIKGSSVEIYRGLFNSNNVLLTGYDNPLLKFKGFVNNYTLVEDYDSQARASTNTIQIECASVISVLTSKHAGRKCNPESMKKFYPTDLSMDRVPTLVNSYFDFGAQ